MPQAAMERPSSEVSSAQGLGLCAVRWIWGPKTLYLTNFCLLEISFPACRDLVGRTCGSRRI